ncbi:hypothetical protein D5H75_12900 [Bailinhaonella thermotolerans]|uniref:ARB-07466-like C-terminal domain-containing protein n=2 Tax=Bailinhaonella thermotolerans TaxID=1070861 RepID=A0A3A4BMY1_9ACTN|nr:hypothetical protein D5H75_12900 [Bailinhaonella thermotolerans]
MTALVATTSALLIAVATPGSAAPGSYSAALAADPSKKAQLDKLTKQNKALAKLYRGELHRLDDLEASAKKAEARAARLRKEYSLARAALSRFAQSAYMGGDPQASLFLTAGDSGERALDGALTLSQYALAESERVKSVKVLAKEAKEAEEKTARDIEELKRSIKELAAKRRHVEKLMAKYGFQRPGGSAGLTGRMISVRDAIMQEFPMPYGVGCLRPGDRGEHGVGRACDFMMSTGGRMPGPEDLERGDRVSQWAISNASRLGIMYIIWKQRIYDFRQGGGWKPMSDRGSITQNHWDHVHISVF